MTLMAEDGQEESEFISPSKVKDIFRHISPEDARFMGFDYPTVKPEYMIHSDIPVSA